MRWISLIASFLIGRLNSMPGKEGPHFSLSGIYDEVAYKSRRLIALTILGFASMTLFCAGVIISLMNATVQYDRNNIIAFTATFNSGLVLAVIGAVGFAVIFMEAWPGLAEEKSKARVSQQEEAPRAHAGSGIETAVASLIMDFVKEREFRRAQRADSFRSSATQGESQNSYNPADEFPPVYHS